MYPLLKESQRYFRTQTNSLIFTLYSKITVGILLVSFILVSTYDYIDSGGSAIQCLADKKIGISTRMLNSYCWFSSTYTLPKHWTGRPELAWGVGISSFDDERVYHAYYQWVPYCLVLLMVLFSLPYFIWENSFGDKIPNLVTGVKVAELRMNRIAQYVMSRNHQHWTFLCGLLYCEALSLIIVGLVIFLMDKLLGGNFYGYGAEVLQWHHQDPEERADPMSRIFPRVTKCDFYRFGTSGTVVNYDALCILAINVLNEKIFLFLWFWLVLVMMVGSLLLSLRILSALSKDVRKWIGRFYFGKHCLKINDLKAEEWLLIQQLYFILEKQRFEELLAEINFQLDKRMKKESLLFV